MTDFKIEKDNLANDYISSEEIQSTNMTTDNMVIGHDLQALNLEQMNSFSALVYDLDTKYVGYRIHSLIPTATVLPYAGGNQPNGFFLCNGQAISRTIYAELFAVISTNYGIGDGFTTFNVPDLRSRIPLGAGQGSGLSNRVLASGGGQENISQVPPHTHNINDPGHAHGYVNTPYPQNTDNVFGTETAADNAAQNQTTTTNVTGISVLNTGTNVSGGNVDIMNPFLVLNYIIKY